MMTASKHCKLRTEQLRAPPFALMCFSACLQDTRLILTHKLQHETNWVMHHSYDACKRLCAACHRTDCDGSALMPISIIVVAYTPCPSKACSFFHHMLTRFATVQMSCLIVLCRTNSCMVFRKHIDIQVCLTLLELRLGSVKDAGPALSCRQH